MPPIVLILDPFAAIATPAGCAFMAAPVLPCTPTATEPHAKRSNRQAFGAPNGMQPTGHAPHPVGKTP